MSMRSDPPRCETSSFPWLARCRNPLRRSNYNEPAKRNDSLNTFVDAQIFRATERQRGKAATEYELITGSSNRLQIVCKKCGRVTDITDKAITTLVQDRKYSNFNMQHFSLFIYGECRICRKKKIKTKA